MPEDIAINQLINVLKTAKETDEIYVEYEGKEFPIKDYDWVTDTRLVLRIK